MAFKNPRTKWAPHKRVSKHEKQLRRLGFRRWHGSEHIQTALPLPFFRICFVCATPTRKVYDTYARDERRRDWFINRKVDLKPLGFVQLIGPREWVDIETVDHGLAHPKSVIYLPA